jgi:hypothetical protein
MVVRKIYRYLLAAVLLFFAAVCITEIFFGSVKLDYCKNIIPYKEGSVAIQEDDMTDTIVYADVDGEILGQIRVPYINFISGRIRNYFQLVISDSGDIYVMDSVYSKDGEKSWETFRCRFDLGILQKVWDVEPPDGYTYSELFEPVIRDGELVMLWHNDETDEYRAFAYDTSGNARELDNEEFYSYDNEKYYDAVKQMQEDYEDELTYFQAFSVIDADTFAVCYENDGDLNGFLVENGNEHYYEKLTGYFQWSLMIRIWILLIIFALIIRGMRLLLGLRATKKLSKELSENQDVRFASLSSSIALLSGVLTVVLMAAISSGIYNDIKSRYEFWITADCQGAAKYIIDGMQNANVMIEDDMPSLNTEMVDESIAEFRTLMKNRGENENYNFLILMSWEDTLYSVYYVDCKSTYPADRIISRVAAANFAEAIAQDEYLRFEDKWTTGLIKYTAIPFKMYSIEKGEYVDTVVGVSTDSYTETLYYLSVVPKIMAIILLLGVIFWIMINVILGFFLNRIKKLGNDLKIYSNTGDPQCFNVKGEDEIGQTAHTFRAMAGGIEVHKKDIMDSNSNYKKLLPSGIMQLMGKERITQVNVGDYCEVEAVMLLFTFHDTDVITRDEQIHKVMSFADKYQGIITHFNRDELYMAVSVNWDIGVLTQNFETEIGRESGMENGIKLFVASGVFNAGSSGSEQNAYLTATGKVFRQLLTLEDREKGEVNG